MLRTLFPPYTHTLSVQEGTLVTSVLLSECAQNSVPAKSAEGACAKQMRVQTSEQRDSVFVHNGGATAWRAATKEEKNETAQQQGGK